MNAHASDAPVTIRKRPRPELLGTTSAATVLQRSDEAASAELQSGGNGLKLLSNDQNICCPDDNGKGYKVGYGNPPIVHRFSSKNQPAKRGRKPKPKSTRDAELALVNARYPHTEKGKQVMLNGYELMARVRFQKALKGDLRAMKEIIINTMPTAQELDELAQGRPLTEHEANAWKAMMDIVRGNRGDNDA